MNRHSVPDEVKKKITTLTMQQTTATDKAIFNKLFLHLRPNFFHVFQVTV